MKLLPILLTLAFPASLSAEGIPVDPDTGKIIVPHTIIDLTADQQQELEALGTVTLTSGQWAKLRKSSPATPLRFDSIVPIDSKDCTCGPPLDAYAIAFDRTRIAVLQNELHAEDIAEELQADYRHDPLHVDHRGQFHYLGYLIPFPLLLEAVSKPVRLVDGKPPQWRGVSLPPGLDRENPAIRARLTQLETAATEAGWEFVVFDAEE